MKVRMLYERPSPADCPPYYFTYIDKVPTGDVIDLLRQGISETVGLLDSLPKESGSFRYAEGKWTICEVIGHMIDCERVFAYRGLRIGRGDATPMPGFEQDDYVAATDFSQRSISSLLNEFQVVRASTLYLFENMTTDEIARTGTASGGTFSTRSMPFIIAGHEIHHIGVLKEKYLPGAAGL